MNRRNIYIALLFNNGSPYHLTVRYYAKASEAEEKELIRQVEAYCSRFRPRVVTLPFSEPAMFGPRRNIPVLRCTIPLPEWIEGLRLLVPGADTYPFNPHVTTDDAGPLALAVTGVAVMHKKEVLYCYQVD